MCDQTEPVELALMCGTLMYGALMYWHLCIGTYVWGTYVLALKYWDLCMGCSSTVVDEAHCLFIYEHPTIVEARDLFLAAVVPPVAALSSLRYADFWALSATGGCVPLSALVKYVAVCTFVFAGTAISRVVLMS